MSARYRPHRAIFTLQAIVIALVALIFGGALLVLASTVEWFKQRAGWQSVLNNLGGAVITSIALFALWDLFGRRAFSREILEDVRYAEDIRNSGLTRIGMDYLRDPDWQQLFTAATDIDIFFSYGRTWRHNHHTLLVEFAKKKGACLRVHLPDPTHKDTITVLAGRFAKEESEMVSAIREAQSEFAALWRDGGATIEVYRYRGDFMFSCYRFDSTAIITLYTHQRERVAVPTVVCEQGGSLYQYLCDELSGIRHQSERVFPSASQVP